MSEPCEPGCRTCYFYRPPETQGPGECRKRSPRAVEDRRTGAWRSQWPPVWADLHWCGDWRPDEIEPEDDGHGRP